MSGSTQWRDWWWRRQFVPGVLGWWINPFCIARQGLVQALRPLLGQLRGDVIDVGCGRMPYRSLVPARRYVGVDVDTPVTRALAQAEVFYDGRRLPFADGSFDGMLCSQVIEHVPEPMVFLKELERVLRPGGLLVLTTPFVWDEHEQPHDYARHTSFGLPVLLNAAGLEMVTLVKTVPNAAALAQLWSAWIFKVTRSRWRAINGITQLMLIVPVNLAGAAAAALLPANDAFYLDNVVLARKRPRLRGGE